MRLRSTNLLGVTVDSRQVACAQLVGGAGSRALVRQAARFEAPAGVSLEENPEAFGAAFKEFLALRAIGASRAIVGVPARWLIAEGRDVPPVAREAALASLRLQAERIGSGGGDDAGLLFDAAGTYGNGQAGHALLVGIARDRLDRVSRFCKAAGLSPAAVTATGLVVAELLRDCDSCPIILLGAQGSELVWRTPHGPRALRHLSGVRGAGPFSVGPALGAELRRILSLGQPAVGDNSGRVLLVGDGARGEADAEALAQGLGRPVEATDPLRALRHLPAVASLNGQADHLAAEQLWPAVALAVAGAQAGGRGLPINFLRPRLAAPRVRRWNRNLVAGIAAGVLVVVGGYVLWDQTRRAEIDATDLERRLNEMSPEIKAAESRIARAGFGRGFFETRPQVLECLSEVTSAFGPEDAIWTTSFTMRDNGRGQLQGRAADNRTVLQLRDRLTINPRLADVQLVDLRDAAGSRGSGDAGVSGEVSFTLGFRYVGGESTAPAGEGGPTQ